MIKNLYAVKDVVAGRFDTPFLSDSDAVAMRDFKHAVSVADSKSLLGSHPNDFQLFNLGTYCVNTGVVEPIQPVVVADETL